MEPEDSNHNKNGDANSYTAGIGEPTSSKQGLQPGSAKIPLETHLDALTNERRRIVIRLLEADAPRDLDGLTNHVTSSETGEPVDDVSRQARKRVWVALYQSHLRKLNSYGIIDWSGSEDDATRGPEFARAVAILDIVEAVYEGRNVEIEPDAEPHDGLLGRLRGWF